MIGPDDLRAHREDRFSESILADLGHPHREHALQPRTPHGGRPDYLRRFDSLFLGVCVGLLVFVLGVAVGIYAGQATCARPAQQVPRRVHTMT